MLLLLPLIILLFAVNAYSQNLKVQRAGNGKAKLTLGKTQKILDLSKDLAGCVMAYDRSDPKLKKFDVSSFRLIDSVTKGGAVYAVLLGVTIGNCNVQGQCGATDAYTLYWLKLSKTLTVLEKQVAVIQDCMDDINMAEDTALALYKGTLTVKYDDNLYRESLDYSFSTLTYNHSEPEKGFFIKIEKRNRPSN